MTKDVTNDEIAPFRIDVPQADLDDLRERVQRTRWAPPHPDTGWDRGVPEPVLRDLAEYWISGYDWPTHEAALNATPQFRTEIDGQPIHFQHVRSDNPDALPLVLTHGWPGAITEFRDLVPLLIDDFHLVIPALPGYGFSSPLTHLGWSPREIARAWLTLMDRLGYDRFGVQGGDWGSFVSRQLGLLAPDRVAGVHLNLYLSPVPKDLDRSALTDRERRHLERRDWFFTEGRGYNVLQATRPDTLGYALADSPVGQLAWIVEKFHDWTDPGERFGGIATDDVLTVVSLYWFTRTAASSAQLYWERLHSPTPVDQVIEPSPAPTAFAIFAHDIAPALRSVAEEKNVVARWSEFGDGGHFAAMEQPAALAADVREFFSSL